LAEVVRVWFPRIFVGNVEVVSALADMGVTLEVLQEAIIAGWIEAAEGAELFRFGNRDTTRV
jgi:hypothetical protein